MLKNKIRIETKFFFFEELNPNETIVIYSVKPKPKVQVIEIKYHPTLEAIVFYDVTCCPP
jgi:hypothetical protein